MSRIPLFRITLTLGLCLLSSYSSAGLLDKINQIADTVLKVSDSGRQVVGDTTSTAPVSGVTKPSESDYVRAPEPFNLRPYPQAELRKNYINPFDRVRVPISPPRLTPEGFVADYIVPMEGKVHALQYIHRSDDSPLLISAHYEKKLLSQGFEKINECDSACQTQSYYYPADGWRKLLNTSNTLDSNLFPDAKAGSFQVFYRPDAIVLIGVGAWGGGKYTSLIYTVAGKATDTSAVAALKASRAPQEMKNQSTQVKSAPTVSQQWADGSELLVKLDKVKLLSEPKTNAKVLGILSKNETVIFLGKEEVTYLQVSTEQGDGWIDKRLLKNP